MSIDSSPIVPTRNDALERALRDKLLRRSEAVGSLGELEPLAVRLGLIQGHLKPRLAHPQIVVFAADHGFVVDRILPPSRSTATQLRELLTVHLPLPVFARFQGVTLTAVDAGVAEAMEPHPGLLSRKIAHGTRHCRVSPAMSMDHAHAAIRAGMEIADSVSGNVMGFAGIGEGAFESAALLISRLADVPLRELLATPALLAQQDLARQLVVLQGAQGRHRSVVDPVEVLAAFGGFESAMMVGAMLVAASKRSLIVVDGMSACAAMMVAGKIAPAVLDYCVFARSNPHPGLTRALGLFGSNALLELGMSSTDGTGAVLAWPLINCAAALLTEVADGEDPGPTYPVELRADTAGGAVPTTAPGATPVDVPLNRPSRAGAGPSGVPSAPVTSVPSAMPAPTAAPGTTPGAPRAPTPGAAAAAPPPAGRAPTRSAFKVSAHPEIPTGHASVISDAQALDSASSAYDTTDPGHWQGWKDTGGGA